MRKESIRIGQNVKVVDRKKYYHGFKIGEIITVMELHRTTCFCSNNRFEQFVQYDQIANVIDSLNHQTRVI